MGLPPVVRAPHTCVTTETPSATSMTAVIVCIAYAVQAITLWLLVALAIAIMFCTGMIYGCLKTIPRWNTWMTPAKYVLFGLMSGAVLLPAVLSLRPAEVGPVGKPMMAILLLAIGMVFYVAYLLKHPRKTHRINDALGFREGNVRLLDAGHSHGTFLSNEFGFVLAREQARLLRWVAIIGGFVLPLLLCYFTKWFWAASVICLIGLLVERWLFFAEAIPATLARNPLPDEQGRHRPQLPCAAHVEPGRRGVVLGQLDPAICFLARRTRRLLSRVGRWAANGARRHLRLFRYFRKDQRTTA